MEDEPSRPATPRIPRQASGPPAVLGPPRAEPGVVSTLSRLVPSLGAVAVVVAVALRVLAAAAYDPSTALALVGSAGELTVIVGALLATMPYVALALVLSAATAIRRQPLVTVPAEAHPPAGTPRGLLLVAGGLAGVLLVFAAPWYLTVVAVAVGALLAWLSAGRRRPAPTEEELAHGGWHHAQRRALAQMRRGSRRAATVGALVVTALFLIRLDVWAPTEQLEFTSGPSRVAYVMSTDQDWTTLLTYPDRQILRVRSESITTRAICETGTALQETSTLWELAAPLLPDAWNVARQPGYPDCPR